MIVKMDNIKITKGHLKKRDKKNGKIIFWSLNMGVSW